MVTLKRVAGELRLTVVNDGKGIDLRRAGSGLGGRLVEGFALQLGGRVERKSSSTGTTVCLVFPSRAALVQSGKEQSDRGFTKCD